MTGFVLTMARETAIITMLLVGILWGISLMWEGWITRDKD